MFGIFVWFLQYLHIKQWNWRERERKKVSLERSTTDISYCVLLVFLFLLLLYYSLLFFWQGFPRAWGGFLLQHEWLSENDFGHFCFINAISKNCFSEHFDIFRFWYIIFSSVRICSFSVSIRVGFFSFVISSSFSVMWW